MVQGRSTEIIWMLKWIRTSRLSIKNSLSTGLVRRKCRFEVESGAAESHLCVRERDRERDVERVCVCVCERERDVEGLCEREMQRETE